MNSNLGGFLPQKGNDSPIPNIFNAGSQAEREKKNGSVMPVTLRMITDANINNGQIYIDSIPCDMVSAVARIIRFQDDSNKINFYLDDATSCVLCICYKTGNKENPKFLSNIDLENFPNQYVQAIIQIRTFKDKCMKTIQFMESIKDYNQITFHFAKTFQNSCQRKFGYLDKLNKLNSSVNQNQNQKPKFQFDFDDSQSNQLNDIQQAVLNTSITLFEKVQKVIKFVIEKKETKFFTQKDIFQYFENTETDDKISKVLQQCQQNGLIFQCGNGKYQDAS